MAVSRRFTPLLLLLLLGFIWDCALAYQTGDAVPVARRGQFHGQTTSWTDQLGRHCPHFGVDTEVVMPLPKPVGFTESESYKVSFQFGKEKYLTPWLLVIGRKQVPMLEVTLRHSGGDLEGVTAKIVPMPENYLKEHDSIRQKFADPEDWPKHILVHYIWVEKSEIDVVGGLYVLFFSGNILFVITAIYILQSSKEKLSRFLNENVVQTSMVGEVSKAD
ncbi:hypothetical protein KC19_9G149700 [Ceratodon purpureus]|uniref:Uncharacterized protein n=1 Tax=Ceratodon purpureus TaxID=3225 RepID=A0A8T0GV80_CERPU|nr:hypothetical protein KC19_9G149700 [Ceratodon purpureus]